MNGSQSWGDYPPASPLFVPSRLELMLGSMAWVKLLPNVLKSWEDRARDLSGLALTGWHDEWKIASYDAFIRDLLDHYADQEIATAQLSFIRSETERMERENNTKGDADNG